MNIRFLSFLTVVTVFMSCSSEKDKLIGVWKGAYVYGDHGDGSYTEGHIPDLIEFTYDSIYIKKFAFPLNGIRDTVLAYTYEFEDDCLIYADEKLFLESANNDSLVFRRGKNDEIIQVYKKVTIESSPDPDYHLGLYSFVNPEYYWMVEIFSEERLLKIGNEWGSSGMSEGWYVSEYKDLKFFVMTGQYGEPLLIEDIQNDEITLLSYYYNINPIFMERLDDYDPPYTVSGSWKELPSEDGIYYWQMFWPYLKSTGPVDKEDTLAQINFHQDSVTIKEFGQENTLDLWRSQTERFFIVSRKDTTGLAHIWKIKIENDSLNLFIGFHDRTSFERIE